MDEVVQVPAETLTPSVNPPVKEPFSIKRFLDVGSWAALFILTPIFFIAFLSQNSNPGDLLYPVKRGVEGVIIAAASVNPTTKAFLHSDLADRRFSEAEKLLLSQADTAPLNDLVLQVQSVETAIASAEPTKQAELTTKVIAQIDNYQAKLTNTAAQIASSPTPFAQAPTQISTQPQTQPQTTNPVAVSSPPTTAPTTQIVTSTPTPSPTATINPSQNPQPTLVQTNPTTAPSVTSIPFQIIPTAAPASVGTPQVEEQKRQVGQAVAITKLKLEKVKKDLEEQSKIREEKAPHQQIQQENSPSQEDNNQR